MPDITGELDRVARARDRIRAAVRHRLDAEMSRLAAARSRPVLADPANALRQRHDEVAALRTRATTALRHRVERAVDDVTHTRARVRALSPAATLERGYAVVQRMDDTVVRDPADVTVGDPVRLLITGGELGATITSAETSDVG